VAEAELRPPRPRARAADRPRDRDLPRRRIDGRFGSVRTVRFDVDGRPVSCQVTGHEAKRRRSGSTKATIVHEDEELTIDVPRDALQEIARGQAVTVAVGAAHMDLSQEQMTLFAAVTARIGAGR
jgi:hypothetical protein